MGGSKKCKETSKTLKKVVKVGRDYEDKANWHHQLGGQHLHTKKGDPHEISIKKVGKKNTVKVRVGNIETEMFADSGTEVSIVPSTWYEKGMGKLQATNDILKGYGASEPLLVEAKFRTKITTKKGASTESWVYVVNSDHKIQPLLGDDDSTALGFLSFRPEGREPTYQEREIRGISAKVTVGKGPMPDSSSEPDITDKEREECWAVINDPKYSTIFDKHIGTMKNRKPITLHGDESKRIISQPYRPVPPQFREKKEFLRIRKMYVAFCKLHNSTPVSCGIQMGHILTQQNRYAGF